MGSRSFKDLEVWKIAMDLVVECYRITKDFPKEELFGLSSQIRRAAGSIPANIAEGQGRDHLKEFIHHLSIANGSLCELETHLIISERLRYLNLANLQNLLTFTARIGQMITRLRQSLKKRL